MRSGALSPCLDRCLLVCRTEVRVILPRTAAPTEPTPSQTNIQALQTQEANAHLITQ